MADDYGAQGLNGIEIIDDLLAQLRKKLIGDCNLRSIDNYSRGYSAKITYDLKCYGLDQVTVDGESSSGRERDDTPDEGGDGELIVDQEEDLSEVRERIERAKEDQEQNEGEDLEVEVPTMERTADGIPVTGKRRYTKRVKLAAGGAEDFKE